jgi:hypothetical protein
VLRGEAVFDVALDFRWKAADQTQGGLLGLFEAFPWWLNSPAESQTCLVTDYRSVADGEERTSD